MVIPFRNGRLYLSISMRQPTNRDLPDIQPEIWAKSDQSKNALGGPAMPDRRKHSEDISSSERRDMVWPYLWESQQHNLLLRQVTELEYKRGSIPVWCVTGGAGSMPVFPGPFVRYEDFPGELLTEFLDGQEVPIGPFYCTAYAEDVRLFLELRRASRET